MKLRGNKPFLIARKGEKLHLSMYDLVWFLQAILQKGKPVRFQAKGFSMSPFIKNNDVITIYPLMETSLKQGDVVAFVRPESGRLSVHRIVKKREKFYSLKGDNTYETDGLVQEENILGWVKKVERNGKKISLGFGPERSLIAAISRSNIFFSFFLTLRNFIRAVFKRPAV